MLPSASFTVAVRLPPPTSVTSWWVCAPGGEELAQSLLDVLNGPVSEGPCQAPLVAVGVQADFLAADREADVVGFVHVRLCAQKLAVQRFRLRQVSDGIDE